MNTFAVVVLCFQACLVQNVFSQCTSGAAVVADPGLIGPTGFAAPYGLGAGWNGLAPAAAAFGPAAPFGYPGYAGIAELGYPGVAPWAAPCGAAAPYGGAGEGNVATAGDLPVAGTTAVAGQVPIMGAVSFGGGIPAAGSVSITANCACGCGF